MTATDVYSHPDYLAFLVAILSAPEDDTPRLVLADWLEEHGESERAEFIRVQVELARIRAGGGIDGALSDREFVILNERARDWFTLDGWKPQWTGGEDLRVDYWAQGRDWTGAGRADIDRGFVARINCTAADWLAHADSLTWRPEQTVECPECIGTGWVIDRDGHVTNWTQSRCDVCDRGRVARPCPPTAQPITKVTLTTWPNIAVPGIDAEDWATMSRVTAAVLVAEELGKRHRGITLTLPA